MPIHPTLVVCGVMCGCVMRLVVALRRAGVNDAEDHATELAERIEGLGRTSDYHVNLIPVNKGPGHFARPPERRMERFAEVLQEHNIAATLRISKGQDIAAGCGQLKVPEGRAAAVASV